MWNQHGPVDPPPRCTVCGDVLTGDKDDEPWHPGGALCGECERARAFDDQLWAMGAAEEDEDDSLW